MEQLTWEMEEMKRIAAETDNQVFRGILYTVMGSFLSGSERELLGTLSEFAQNEIRRLTYLDN